MEDFGTHQSLDASGPDLGSIQIGDSWETLHADDPLGDEAAFPMTWQHLASGDAARD